MSCNIEFNKDGKIARVNTIDGKESKLFRQIAQIPHIKTLEEALDSYKNIFSSKLFYSISGKIGASNLDKTDTAKREAEFNRKIPVFTKNTLEKEGMQQAKKAFENYTSIVLPLSPTYYELESIFEVVNNSDVLEALPYNLIEEDYGVTRSDIESLVDKYETSFNKRAFDNITRIEALTHAEIMEKVGATPKEIRLSTGWERGTDNKWRYEISDGTIKNITIENNSINNSFTNPNVAVVELKDVYDSSELYKAYPKLEKTKVIFYEDESIFGESVMFEHNGSIYINKKDFVDEENRFTTDKTTGSRGTALQHEIQHLLQDIEGFAGGSNPEWVKQRIISSIDYLRSRTSESQRRSGFDGKFDEYIERTIKNNESTKTAIEDNIVSSELIGDALKMYVYAKFAGEVEARNVQKRVGLTEQERRNTLLFETEDVRRDLQYVEPTLTFKSDQGNTFNSFKEALQDSVGGDMEIGIETQEGFKPLHTVSSNMNVNTTGGLINNLIANDIISGEKAIEDGVSYLKAEGFDPIKQMVNEAMLPSDKFKVHKDGRIEILEEKEQKSSNFFNAVKDFLNRVFGAKSPQLSEEALQSRLLEFLKDINVSVLTLDEYSKKYKTKNGVDPSAEALADIANQVVAFREGRIQVNELAEETAHFIIEAWSKEDIEGLISVIHKTQSYLDHSEVYRQIYTRENPNMSAQEIEYLVRKEVLGKELAHNLVNNFQTETNPSIIQRMWDLLTKFFDTILLRDNYKDKLDNLTFKVQDLILNKNINRYLDTSQYKNKKFRLYSVNPQSALARALQEQERVLKELNRGSSDQIRELEDMVNKAMSTDTLNALNSLAKRQAIYIKEAVKEANRRGAVLSNEENIVYNNLKDSILPALTLVKASIKSNPTYAYQNSDIESVIGEINDVMGMVQLSKNDNLEKIVDRLIETFNLNKTPEVVDELKKAIQTVEKDTASLYQYFGLVTHAQDPLLNILGNVSGKMYQEATEEAYKRVKDFQNKLRELGFKEKDVARLLQSDGWIVSEWDFNEGEEFDKAVRLSAYWSNLDNIIDDLNIRKTNGEDVQKELDEHLANKSKNPKDLLENFKHLPLITNTEINEDVVNEANRLKALGSESYLSDKYLAKQEGRFKDLDISTDTQKLLKKFSNMRARVRATRKVSKSGTPIMTIANKQDMDAINHERKKAMSPYREDGSLKDGLEIVTKPEKDTVKINDTEYLKVVGSLSKEARIALDMNKLVRDFIDNKSPGASNDKIDLNGKWFQDLLAMESDPEVTRQDIIDWFNANTSVGFSKEFFEKNDVEDIFDDYSNDPEISEEINTYKKLIIQRRNVLALYRDSNNSTNTNVNAMNDSVKANILELSQEIENEFSKVSKYLKGKGTTFVERNARTGANESYFGYIADHNLNTYEQKYEFTLKHMTAGNKKKVRAFRDAVESKNIPEKLQRISDEFGDTEEAVLKYAQSKLLPYYASYAPLDLQNFYNKLREGDDVSEAVKELNQSPDVRLSVSYDYLDVNSNDILNPNRREDFKGGGWQPSLTKKPTITIGNYSRTFDFKNKNWDKLLADKKLKELYDYYIDFQAQSQKSNNVEGSNIYLPPQVEATKAQKIKQMFSKEARDTAKEFVANLYQYRVSDMTEGELDESGNALSQSHIRIIPRYFTHRLENKSNVSKDLFYSSAMMAQQSELRRSRVKYYSQMSSIMEAIENQGRYANIGKRAESTNTYKMAKSYADYAFFGIEDTAKFRVNIPIIGQTDMTKWIKTLHKWKQNLALAFTPVSPLTSLFTAIPNLIGEWGIGQYVDDDSVRKAGKEMMNKDVWQVDILNPYSTGKSMVMLEHFGIIDFTDRFKNSNMGRGARLLEHAGYAQHTMADYPIKANVLLTQLYGHRVYQGNFYSYDDFKAMMSGKDKSEVKRGWREAKPLYEYMSVEKGKVKYNDQLLKDLNLTEEQFKLREDGIISKAKAMAQRVDGTIRQEEKTYAQRNYALRYTMTHKGWQALSYSYRFKGRHLNLQTGEIEEGSYRTLGNLLSRSINTMFNERDLKAVYKLWTNATTAEKKNLIRIMVDTGVLASIYFLGLAFAGFADDDEEDYMKQATAYLFERVTNETISSQLGLFPELYNTIKEPIVGVTQVSDLVFGWHKIFTGDEKVKSGRYYGLTTRERWLIKNISGLKPAYDLSNAKNLKSQRDSYNHFAGETEMFNPLAWIITRKEYLEDDEE